MNANTQAWGFSTFLGPVLSDGGGKLPKIPESFGLSPKCVEGITKRFGDLRRYHYRKITKDFNVDPAETTMQDAFGASKGFLFVIPATGKEDLIKLSAKILKVPVLWAQSYDNLSTSDPLRVVFGIVKLQSQVGNES
jgi:hypothetical protein